MRWPTGLSRQPLEARAFYATVAIATAFGVAMNFVGIDPIRALFWAAVLNGIVAVPVMALMMLMTSNTNVMGEFTVQGPLNLIGWTATGVMALAVIGLAYTSVAAAGI